MVCISFWLGILDFAKDFNIIQLDWFLFRVIIYCYFYILAGGGNKAQKRGNLMNHIYLVYERSREECFEKERLCKQI